MLLTNKRLGGAPGSRPEPITGTAARPDQLRGARAALVIAHPGHEVRVHGWLEQARPCVFVLTDGSGRDNPSRLASTTRVLAAASAKPGGIYGRLPDREIYQLVLKRRAAALVGLAEDLANELAREGVDYVVGDAAEGAILAHDVCRLVINAAAVLLARAKGQPVANYDFSPTEAPQPLSEAASLAAIQLELDDVALRRKMQAAFSYPEIRHEVEAVVGQLGTEGLRSELLRPVTGSVVDSLQTAVKPQYELHGERLVSAGIYPEVIRYHEHFLPLVEAFNEYLEKMGR